ncbi:hypothetical protein I553_9754 [Mycobacterium xenopi 4042]|uniref:Uncharacterized protein n=1 Tax=Mycobacterium xenopi 4042 TaxID=1299334 RepID=X7YQB7_MYCXE|nr:hypothetical protein I553_9754 [Mycobacterium xenopi 4042]
MDEVSFSDLQLKGKATVERWLRRSAGRPCGCAGATPRIWS